MSRAEPVGGSWPSEGNCAGGDNGGVSASDGDAEIERLERIIESVDDDLARRAVSVVPGRMLRRECVREIRGSSGSYKSKTVRGVLKAFLKWAVEQLDSELVFESEDGRTVKAPVPVSISEEKAKEYYARLKDIERALVARGPHPHTAMLTLTGSSENANGDPRSIVDQIADVQESWDPAVRRELQRVMDEAGFERFDPNVDYDEEPVKYWEYVTVIEPHDTGFGHFHVGVFASHELDREMFAPVMEKHVEECQIAGSEAHRVHGEDRAVSVNSVDPSKEYDPDEELEDITNLGSYLSEYIGAFSEGEFLERPVHELVFYAACWATGRQRVRFSNGANRMARVGQELRDAVPEPSEPGWSVKEIERPDGESHPPHTGGGIEMVPIRGAPSVDPRPVRN